MTERTKRKLLELDGSAKEVFAAMIELLDRKLGDDFYIVYEGRRSLLTQEAYFAQGRASLEEVNDKRKKAGLYLLRSERDNYPITWTLKSKHIEGLAMDVLPVTGTGNPTWDLAHYRGVFEKIAGCGRKAGLECGADWASPETDWPHYEIKGGS